jgi:hypothetical protein
MDHVLQARQIISRQNADFWISGFADPNNLDAHSRAPANPTRADKARHFTETPTLIQRSDGHGVHSAVEVSFGHFGRCSRIVSLEKPRHEDRTELRVWRRIGAYPPNRQWN